MEHISLLTTGVSFLFVVQETFAEICLPPSWSLGVGGEANFQVLLGTLGVFFNPE